MTDSRYISCAETAKLVRKDLKTHFPGVKFSVRSNVYSMGASINVRYTSGPSTPDRKAVEAVVSVFSGSNFDGSIDLKTHHSSYLLLDGTVIVAKDYGTEGSGGYLPSVYNDRPEGAELVSFGADFIFVSTIPTY